MNNVCKYKKIYTEEQISLISKEFTRLKDHYYLDHAGATLYSEKQLKNVFTQLSENLYANPHSRNLSSKLTEDSIDIVRYQVLTHFNTNPEEYSIIFTSGATASLKIIGEYFSYRTPKGTSEGTFAYLQDNHTSALGIRHYAKNSRAIKSSDAFSAMSGRVAGPTNALREHNSLFVYPAQSNFSGAKYPLSWIDAVKNGALNKICSTNSRNWFVALDAASYVATNKLDLSEYKPDFVTISFYKMFGYPTGLGALLVRNASAHVLNKIYFGGGTVLMILGMDNEIIPRLTLQEKFEDGTLPFLSILAVSQGFDTINRLHLDFTTIAQHVFYLAQYVYRNLQVLMHPNGKPVAILYHVSDFENIDMQGGIINFNLLRANGENIGYSEILHFSNLYGIHLRTGCFCNPGSCQSFLQLSSDDIRKHFKAGHVCGDQHDLVDGRPTGSVRISFGYMSTKKDADKFLGMIRTCFVANSKKPTTVVVNESTRQNELIQTNNNTFLYKQIAEKTTQSNFSTNYNKGVLQQIFLYPIKSCGAFNVQTKWPITSTGLLFDRQWMIVNSSGVCFTQKHSRNMCLIRPAIDIEKKILKLSFMDQTDISISLINNAPRKHKTADPCQSKVCGDQIRGWDCGDEVAEWISRNLDCPGLRLLKQCNEVDSRTSKQDDTVQLSFTNKAQYLLLNLSSVDWLRSKVPDNELSESVQLTVQRFRPNFVVKFDSAFIENHFDEFIFDNIMFKSGGKCTRCQMICIDQSTARSSKEPLKTLSREFKGKIAFGVYLNSVNLTGNDFLATGCEVTGCDSS